MIPKLTALLEKLEKKFGLIIAALIIGCVLLLVACIYVAPAFGGTIGLGPAFQAASLRPFDLGSGSPQRLRALTPFLAYIFFLRGRLYILFPLIMGVLFLTSIYVYFRKQNFSTIQSLNAAMLMAFSSPILFTIHYPGYVDTTSFLLLFLCFIFIEKPIWFLLFAFALLNHECNLFIGPFLLIFANRKFKFSKFIKSLFLFTLACMPYLLCRFYATQCVNAIVFRDVSFTLIKWNWGIIERMLPLGFFMAFKLFWLLPIAFVIKGIKNRDYFMSFSIIFSIISASAMIIIANDTSRILGFVFLAILISFRELKKYYSDQEFTKMTLILIGLNFLVPQYYVGQNMVVPFYPLPVAILFKFFGRSYYSHWGYCAKWIQAGCR